MIFCNINFNQKNKRSLFELPPCGKPKLIITANAAFIVEANNTKRFFEILNSHYVTFDGQIVYICAKILYYFRIVSRYF
jgi:UDP-N-acetyl-D-mannosaminuronic acid transferase (WecB/TagA/CpsF family)